MNASTPIEWIGLSVAARNSLLRADIWTVGELQKRTEADLLALPNFGPTRLRHVRLALARAGLPPLDTSIEQARVKIGNTPAWFYYYERFGPA
jgi:DNA-directed RNA polymerase alpha subunit